MTPTAEPKRYDAFFFITELRADELFTPQADQSETVDSAWDLPTRCCGAQSRRDVFGSSDIIDLDGMARYSSFAELCAQTHDIEAMPYIERARFGNCSCGHEGHPQEDRGLLCHRLRLLNGVWALDDMHKEILDKIDHSSVG